MSIMTSRLNRIHGRRSTEGIASIEAASPGKGYVDEFVIVAYQRTPAHESEDLLDCARLPAIMLLSC